MGATLSLDRWSSPGTWRRRSSSVAGSRAQAGAVMPLATASRMQMDRTVQGVDAGAMREILRSQGGVISRRQVLAQGGDDNLIERMLRRREWRAIHPGVYVDHTGAPRREQERMAAVLFAWPAALVGESALLAYGARHVVEGPVRVGVEEQRRVTPPPGMAVVRLRDFEGRVLWNRSPPRVRLDEAALDVASRAWRTAGEGSAVAVLADLCQQRLTTPCRLGDALAAMPRLAGRPFLAALVDDVASGAQSLLEHRYLTRVERPHGLPRGRRQVEFRAPLRHGFRDVHYADHGLVVELDGRLGHEFARDQWADLDRDLLAAVDQLMTTRLGWGQVVEPCRLALLIGRLLQARGWTGQPRRCPRCPITGALPAPGADDFQ